MLRSGCSARATRTRPHRPRWAGSTGSPTTDRAAVVTTLGGENVRLVVDHDTPLYGRATFGNYRIDAEDVRRIEFSGLTAVD